MANDNTIAITEHQIRALAERHIRRYTSMVESGSPAVRVGECRTLVDIWQSVMDKGCQWANLNEREQQEVFEAYDDDQLD
jgi:hypothetical protein